MAGAQVTGAVHIFPGVLNAAKAFAYLGTGREAPKIRTARGWVPFFNDIGGPKISFDEVFAGEEAMISVVLNRFNGAVLSAITSVPNFLLGAHPGIKPFGSTGTMMLQEGLAYPLVMTFPYFSKPAFKALGMPPGVRYYASFLEGPEEYLQGTVPREINLIWKCKAVYDPRNGSQSLGDNVIPKLPLID